MVLPELIQSCNLKYKCKDQEQDFTLALKYRNTQDFNAHCIYLLEVWNHYSAEEKNVLLVLCFW